MRSPVDCPGDGPLRLKTLFSCGLSVEAGAFSLSDAIAFDDAPSPGEALASEDAVSVWALGSWSPGGSGGVNLVLIVSRNLFKSRPISLVVHCRREALGAFDLFQ